MVNYNSLPGHNEDDDDTDSSPYGGAAFKAVDRPHPGIIYEREAERPRPRVPLGAELLRQEIDKQAADKDKKDKDSDKDDSTDSSSRPARLPFSPIRPRVHRDAMPLTTPTPQSQEATPTDKVEKTAEAPNDAEEPVETSDEPLVAVPEDSSVESPQATVATETHDSVEPISAERPELPAQQPLLSPLETPLTARNPVFEAAPAPPLTEAPEVIIQPVTYGAEVPLPLQQESLPPIQRYEMPAIEPAEQPPAPPLPPRPPEAINPLQPPLPERQPVPYADTAANQQYGLHNATVPEQFPDAPPKSRIPGLLTIALGLEYVNRKIADRKLERNLKRDAVKRYREQQANYNQLAGNQQQFVAEQQRQAAGMQRVEAQQASYVRPEQAAVPLTAAASLAERSPIQAPVYEGPLPQRRTVAAYEQRSVVPGVITPESQKQQATAEQQRKEEALVMTAAIEAQEQEQQRQQEHHREMRDAWRSYEVDEHNREITTARTRGEGFYKEQKELVKDVTADEDDTATIAKGGLTSVVASLHGHTSGQGSLPSGMTVPTLPSGQPAHVDPQHQLAAKNDDKDDSNFSNPLFILMIILIIAAFFTANMLF